MASVAELKAELKQEDERPEAIHERGGIMSRSEMKADESQASYASTAYPFDAYSFPVSSPSEADLEPVAPPPQEAADGAEVCEAKNFLQQLAAGRTTTPSSAAPGKQSDLTSLVGWGAGALLPSLLFARGQGEANPLLREAQTAVNTARSWTDLLITSQAKGEAYKQEAAKIAEKYGKALNALNALVEGTSFVSFAHESPKPLQLYLEALEGMIRAQYFDLRSPDGLTLINQGLLSKEESQLLGKEAGEKWALLKELKRSQGEIDTLLRVVQQSSFSSHFPFHRYSLSKLAAALAMARGYPATAGLYATQAIRLSQNDGYSFPGVEELLRLQLKILNALPQSPAIQPDYESLAKLFEKDHMYDEAAAAIIGRIRIFVAGSENLLYLDEAFNDIRYAKEISDALVELARVTGKLSSSGQQRIAVGETGVRNIDPAGTLFEITNWLIENEEPPFSFVMLEGITKALEREGDFRDAAIMESRHALLLGNFSRPEDAAAAYDQAFRCLERVAAESIAGGDKAPRSGAAAKPPPQPALPKGVTLESIEKDLGSRLEGISPPRREQIIDAVAAAVGRKGSVSGIMENGCLTPRGMVLVLEEIGVVERGTAKPSGVAKAEGFEKGKKDGRKPGRDVVKGGEHVR